MSPVTTLRDVHSALVTRIQAINGVTGGYTFDFTGKPVSRGGLTSHTLPAASIIFESAPAEYGPELGDTQIREVFLVTAFASLISGVSDDVEGRVQSGEAMVEDIRKKLYSDKSLGGLVIDTIIRDVQAIDGAELDVDLPYGMAILIIETYRFYEAL